MARVIKFGVLVVSDSCANGSAVDTSGVNLKDLLLKEDNYALGSYEIVEDDIEKIKSVLVKWSDELKLDLVVSTGGTGLGVRDCTPEATKQILDKEIPSFSQTILIESLKITKFAPLSRAVCGVRKSSLIINLPGSKKGAQESLQILLPILRHSLDLINDSKNEIKSQHAIIQSGTENAAANQPSKQHDHHHHHHHHHHHDDHHAKGSRVTDKDINERARQSTYPMLSMADVLKIVLANSDIEEVETVNYFDALNRVCAQDVQAREPLPPFAASIKDGFAIKLTDEQRAHVVSGAQRVPFVFDVIGSANAGDQVINIELKGGQCVKINTGGPVPLSADAVIQIEDTVALAKNEKGEDSRIEILGGGGVCGGGGGAHQSTEAKINLSLGQDIRPIGFDIKSGEIVVNQRTLIQAPQIGICATVGALKLNVFKLPSVAVISTGNELQSPDKELLSSGQIRDSNKSLLLAALKSFGIEKTVDAGIANDDPNSVLNVFRNALEPADIVISTGGVSMGDKDLVKDVLLKDFGAQIHFARMNMKPGKPTTFATCTYKGRKKLLFCLPGNPVSAIVTFNLVVIPCLKKLKGLKNPLHTQILVKCEFDADLDPRPEFHRCYLVWPDLSNPARDDCPYPRAFSTGNQHSSRLMSMIEANCLVELPGRTKDKPMVHKGEILKALIIEKI